MAFLRRPSEDKHQPTKLRLWQIRFDQFVDVYLQENGFDPHKWTENGRRERVKAWLVEGCATLEINGYADPDDRAELPAELRQSNYRRLVLLSRRHGGPVLTFTDPNEDCPLAPPSYEYVQTIVRGLIETSEEGSEQIADYLAQRSTLPKADCERIACETMEQYVNESRAAIREQLKRVRRDDCGWNRGEYPDDASAQPLALLRVCPTSDRRGNDREFIAHLHPETMKKLSLKDRSLVAAAAWHRNREYRVLVTAMTHPAHCTRSGRLQRRRMPDRPNRNAGNVAEFQIALDEKLRVAIGARNGDWIGLYRLAGRRKKASSNGPSSD